MKLNDSLRWILYLGIFAMPFLVFPVFSDLFFPFITSKAFVFRILVEVLVAVWAVLALRDASFRPKASGITLAIIAFLLAITIASLFGEDFSQSFWSNYERMFGIIGYLHFFAFFLVIGSVLKTREMWHGFFATSLAVSIVVGFQGFAELSDTSRIDASLGNPIYLAAYALLHIFLAAFLFENARRHFRENLLLWFYAGSGIVNIFVLFFTGTRGTMLGLLGGIFLTSAIVAIFEKKQKKIRKFAIALCAIFLLVPGAFFLVKDADIVQDNATLSRFANISLEEGTGGARLDLWEIAWDGFSEKPLFGYGLENYDLVFAEFYQPGLYDEESWFDRAHNVIFNWLAVTGVVGLFGYISIFGALMLSIWNFGALRQKFAKKGGGKTKDAERGFFEKNFGRLFPADDSFSLLEKSLLTGLVAAYFVHGLFVFEDIVSSVLFFAFLAFVYSQTTQKQPSLFGEKIPNKGRQFLWGGVIVFAALLALYSVNYRPLAENIALSNALQAQTIDEKLMHFENALSYQSIGDGEVSEQLVQEYREVDRDNVTAETLNRLGSYAENSMRQVVEMRPNDPRGWFYLALFYESQNDLDQMRESIDEALRISPNKQQFLNLKARTLVNLGQNNEAIDVARRSFELDESNDDAFDLYVQTLIYAGDDEQARQLLEERYGTDDVARDGFINAYAAQENYERLIELWTARVERNPEQLQPRLSLTYAYYRNDQPEEAIAVLEEIKDLNEQFAPRVDQYIADIRAGRPLQ